MTTIVIGVGNRDRGDDAAGLIVCDRLRDQLPTDAAPQVITCEGSILDLGLRWEPDDLVIIVDAMQPVGRPGRIVTVDATADALSTPVAVSTHEIDVSVAIELARAIGRMPARLLVVGIEAAQTDWGTVPSAPVDAAIDSAVTLVHELVAGVVDRAVGHPAANVAS